ncbi:MAG: hypothetical protein AAF367_19425 [Pseudomonadota bacterium]
MRLSQILKVAMLAMIGIVLTGGSNSFAGEKPRRSMFIVIENGGVVQDREGQMHATSSLLGEIAQLRRRKATRDTQIHIVLTANPTEVSWSGTPQQLFEQGHAVLERIAFVNTCSDLVRAWAQVDTTRRITYPDEFDLIGIGPMIHAGFPCGQGGEISLPQAAPRELRLGALAREASRVRLLLVHPDQDEIYLTHLEAAGVLERARSGELDFDVMDAARTQAASGAILERK